MQNGQKLKAFKPQFEAVRAGHLRAVLLSAAGRALPLGPHKVSTAKGQATGSAQEGRGQRV